MAWNKPTNERRTDAKIKQGSRSFVLSKRLCIATTALVAMLATWYFLFSSNAPDVNSNISPTKLDNNRRIAEATPAQASTIKTQKVETAQLEKSEYVKKPGQLQLPSGKILTFPVPKEGQTRKVYASGHTYECDHLGNFVDITPRKFFHTAFEANLFALASADAPYIPAFLVGLDESDVRKMLTKEHTLAGDETDQEIARLKAYDDFRQEALNYMDNGGKFDDFVTELASFDRKQRQARVASLSEIMKLYKAGKIEEAREMAVAANVLMEKQGFKPLTFPVKIRADFENLPTVIQNKGE